MPESSFEWDFDDGSSSATGADQSHEYLFVPGSVYEPTVTATLFGWTSNCIATASAPVSMLPTCELLFSDRFEEPLPGR